MSLCMGFRRRVVKHQGTAHQKSFFRPSHTTLVTRLKLCACADTESKPILVDLGTSKAALASRAFTVPGFFSNHSALGKLSDRYYKRKISQWRAYMGPDNFLLLYLIPYIRQS